MKSTINAKGTEITVISKGKEDDYISLTDIARYKNPDEPKDVVKNWLRSRSTIEFLGLWEQINNPNFKGVEFEAVKALGVASRASATGTQNSDTGSQNSTTDSGTSATGLGTSVTGMRIPAPESLPGLLEVLPEALEVLPEALEVLPEALEGNEEKKVEK